MDKCECGQPAVTMVFRKPNITPIMPSLAPTYVWEPLCVTCAIAYFQRLDIELKIKGA